MFRVGDIISYRAAGVCRVEDIRQEILTGEKKEYYILKPVSRDSATVYVPCDNDLLCSRMTTLLSKADADAIVKKPYTVEPAWVENAKERQATFSAVISSGERGEIAGIIRALFRHKKEVAKRGRKFYASDERLLAAAQKAVVGELAYVLEWEETDVVDALCKE